MTEYLGFVIVLFLLSMICERFADFLKHYLGECNTGLGKKLKNLLEIGDLVDKKPPGSLAEEQRYYRILKINIFCGFLTAWSLHADLFTIVRYKDDPFKAIGWSSVRWFWEPGFAWSGGILVDAIVFLAGCFATGLFISFGSKFWHDLLDILYQVKNYRRLLADPGTYTIDNIKSFDRAVVTYQSDFIKAAFLEAKSRFMAMDNVKVMSLKTDDDGYYFEITVKKPDPQITSRYQYFLSDASPQSVRVKMVVLGDEEVITHAIDLSESIFDENHPNTGGTLGCLVKPKEGTAKTFILTCCHNVIYPLATLSTFKSGGIRVGTTVQECTPIGRVSTAIRDHELDAALIEVDPAMTAKIDNRMPGMGAPKNKRRLLDEDVNKTRIFLCGAVSNLKKGTVTSLYSDVKFNHRGEEFTLINLMVVSNEGQTLSQPGDSGSVVFDDRNNILGLVVGGNPRETFVIPIETLLNRLNVQLA